MDFLKLAAALVLTAGVAMAQQPAPTAPGGMQSGQQQTSPGASQQPGQTNTPATPGAGQAQQPGEQSVGQQPGSQQPTSQQPASQQPSSQEPGQPATQAQPGAQSGMQQQAGQSATQEAGQHPGYPAGPGMIEGCLTQAGGGYAVRSTDSGKEFSLDLNAQTAQNVNLNRDVTNSVGKQVKIYGYPTGAESTTSGSQATQGAQTTTPAEAGSPNGGMNGAGAGNQANAPGPGASSQPSATAPTSAGAQAASDSNALQVTRFIPLNKPCGTSTSQGAQTAPNQTAAQ